MSAIILLFIVVNLQLKLVIPVVSELFFVVLLVSLSYMNRREQRKRRITEYLYAK